MNLNAVEQRLAAKQFAQNWANRGDEKQETQTFWITLLQSVFGVTDPNFIALRLFSVSALSGSLYCLSSAS